MEDSFLLAFLMDVKYAGGDNMKTKYDMESELAKKEERVNFWEAHNRVLAEKDITDRSRYYEDETWRW